MEKTRIYICDLDGTICNMAHRLHYIEDQKDWKSFFDTAVYDSPIRDVIDVIRALAEQDFTEIVYLTGRPERIRTLTNDWLVRHHCPNGTLVMRKDGDHRPDTVSKRELMLKIQESGGRIAGVFEDRPSVVRVWREMGLTVFALGGIEF